MKYHTSVLLNEGVSILEIKPEGTYIDCTLGEAGHSLLILDSLNESGHLVSLEHDTEAFDFVRENNFPGSWVEGSKILNRFTSYECTTSTGAKWQIVNCNFSHIEEVANAIGLEVDGVLMDLGISSRQLDAPLNRGFSYHKLDEPLDMRMDLSLNVTASDLLAVLSEKQLTDLFFRYGEEKFSRQIARGIKLSNTPVKTVNDLSGIIRKAVPTAYQNTHKHPARKVFQALRIAVNDEMHSLEKGLEGAIKLLTAGGVLGVISFHSLEDRIVKNKFIEFARSDKELKILTDKPIEPSENEVEENKRAHSAKLRAIKRLN